MQASTSSNVKQNVDLFVTLKTDKAGVIQGEASEEKHKGEIQISGFSWGMSSASEISSGQASGRRQHKPLRLFKSIDGATAPLASALATNQVVKELTLTARKAAGVAALPYLVIKLSNGRVSRLDLEFPDPDPNAASPNGREVVEIVYQKIEINYSPQTNSAAGGATKTFIDNWYEGS
ncbi:type VI secretion system Hcp family effector [Panacagrimonas perspica]|uniref:Type VI secretion system Hcp family effector n=1 Tax=Panacagrimonas perspica TaxID=381431 RepID=A0A4R7PBV7_9GAMM|nr:type VI secretion system tube protein Hcp [Panacagrimonas perspica]TDU31182.1 type VI secretion system Hcp family effector [Panacagrimonas perspica]THD01054.1 hypothetical protein B1810_21775 [Panacagrimonas perspica]